VRQQSQKASLRWTNRNIDKTKVISSAIQSTKIQQRFASLSCKRRRYSAGHWRPSSRNREQWKISGPRDIQYDRLAPRTKHALSIFLISSVAQRRQPPETEMTGRLPCCRRRRPDRPALTVSRITLSEIVPQMCHPIFLPPCTTALRTAKGVCVRARVRACVGVGFRRDDSAKTYRGGSDRTASR